MPSNMTFFITGTDTNVGKTYACKHLLQQAAKNQRSSVAMKPIASGCDAQGFNEDALILQKAASIHLPYAQINPIKFRAPIAPHIAAQLEHYPLTKKNVSNHIEAFLQSQNTINLRLIEGAGGWHLPLNETELLSEVISDLKIPVILVVQMKLGCLNHALLTVESIQKTQAPFHGWIANCIPPEMPYLKENITYLQCKMPSKYLFSI